MAVYNFSQDQHTDDPQLLASFGNRAKKFFELAKLGIPLIPGFVIDFSDVKRIHSTLLPIKDFKIQEGLGDPEGKERALMAHLNSGGETLKLQELIAAPLQQLESEFNTKYDSLEGELLLKVTLSSNFAIPYPVIYYVGLSQDKLPYLSAKMGDSLGAWYDYCTLLEHVLVNFFGVPKSKFVSFTSGSMNSLELCKAYIHQISALFPGDVFLPQNPWNQLEFIVKMMIATFYNADFDDADDIVLMVQALHLALPAYASSQDGKKKVPTSFYGKAYSRSLFTGAAELSGYFKCGPFHKVPVDSINSSLNIPKYSISKLPQIYKDQLETVSSIVEHYFKDICDFDFVIRNQKLYISNSEIAVSRSTQAYLTFILDMLKKGVVDSAWVVNEIQASHIYSLLYPSIKPSSIKSLPFVRNGLAGAPGSAIGRVYFSSNKLIDAYKYAVHHREEASFILCVSSSLAEDVKAIKVAQGVLSIEGGYASHAPVVARSFGKVSVVNPDIELYVKQDDAHENYFKLGEHIVKEGDYISIESTINRAPKIFFGKAEVSHPDITGSHLLEFF